MKKLKTDMFSRNDAAKSQWSQSSGRESMVGRIGETVALGRE